MSTEMSTGTEDARPAAEIAVEDDGLTVNGHHWASDEAAAAQEELANEPRVSVAEDDVEPVGDVSGDEPLPAPDQSLNQHPVYPGSLPAEDAVAPAVVPAAAPNAAVQPLLTAQFQNELLERWTEIQVSFVDDPRVAVEDAEGLVEEIAAEFQRAFRERSSALASGWSEGADTEELRLALQKYRSFVSAMLPR